jgi:hypothetical protein
LKGSARFRNNAGLYSVPAKESQWDVTGRNRKPETHPLPTLGIVRGFITIAARVFSFHFFAPGCRSCFAATLRPGLPATAGLIICRPCGPGFRGGNTPADRNFASGQTGRQVNGLRPFPRRGYLRGIIESEESSRSHHPVSPSPSDKFSTKIYTWIQPLQGWFIRTFGHGTSYHAEGFHPFGARLMLSRARDRNSGIYSA